MLAFVKEYIESPKIQQKIKIGCCETYVASNNID